MISLTGKTPDCESGEHGSSPDHTLLCPCKLMKKLLGYEPSIVGLNPTEGTYAELVEMEDTPVLETDASRI